MGKSPLLDFRKFKHVKSDDKSTTLQHDDGHVLTIAHHVLSKDNQAALKALANSAGPAKSDGNVDVKDTEDKRPLGKVQMKSEGGNVVNPDKAKDFVKGYEATDSDKAAIEAVNHPIDSMKKAFGYAEGGEVDQSQQVPDALQKPDDYAKGHPQQPTININLGPGTQPIQAGPGAPIPQPAPPKAPDTSTPMGKQQLMIDATKAGMSVPDYLRSIGAPESANVSPMEGQQKMIEATQAGQTVPQMEQQQAAQPQAPAAAPEQAMDNSSPASAVDTPAAIPQVAQDAAPQPMAQPKPPSPADSFMHQADLVKQDFANGHITPKTYESMFANKSTLGKIGTIFGMILGGWGAGLTHGPNMLLEMMNNEIAKDLEAQKASKSNQLNFVKLAEDHVVNKAQAAQMGATTRHLDAETAIQRDALAQQYAMRSAFHSMMLKAQAMPDGPQKQAAMQTLGMVSQGIDAKAMQARDVIAAKTNLSQGLMGAMSMNGSDEQSFQAQQRMLRMTGHEDLAKDNEAKYMPGLGRASVPLTSDDRNKVRSGLEFSQSLRRFTDFAKQHSGALDPKVVNQGKTLAAELSSSYRNAIDGGVYKAGEQKFIDQIIDSDPTKFLNKIRVLPKLEAVAKEHDAKMRNLTKTLGFQNQMPSSMDNAPVKGADGRMYVKDPSGKYMVPVK